MLAIETCIACSTLDTRGRGGVLLKNSLRLLKEASLCQAVAALLRSCRLSGPMLLLRSADPMANGIRVAENRSRREIFEVLLAGKGRWSTMCRVFPLAIIIKADSSPSKPRP
jgi:hypothetical protein